MWHNDAFSSDIQNGFHTWRPNSGTQKMKYTFIYTIILHRRLCFFPLNLSKVYLLVRKHTLSIVNHPTEHQDFNMELLCALQPLSDHLLCRLTVCPKNLWIRHCSTKKTRQQSEHWIEFEKVGRGVSNVGGLHKG